MRLPRHNPQRHLIVHPALAVIPLLTLIAAVTIPCAAQITSNPTALHFGSIVIGQSESLPASLTNTQSTSVTISAISSTSSEFTATTLKLPFVLSPGQTVTFNVLFTPTMGGWSGGALTFISNAANKALNLKIGGVGVSSIALVPTPTAIGFGSVLVGNSATLPVALKNSGATVLVITQAQVTGTGFVLSGAALPATLAPNQTLTLNVAFTPQSASSVAGSLVIPNGNVTIPLSGTGTTTSQLVLTPTALNFGSVDVGSSSTQPVTLTANGGTVTVSSSASSSSQFALQGATFPITIASGKSVSFNVAFTPSANGTVSGNLSIASNAADSNAQEGLSGVGVVAKSNVTISWSPSVSQVVGYNLYRGTSQNGSYSKLTSALDASTTYTDSSVTSGTYYYVATSVNSEGQESAYSAPVQATIP
ncbi:MAG TPA: choice-of-anchor D domain-containing protein [Candidatus Sulfotelmatobacter sp.]